MISALSAICLFSRMLSVLKILFITNRFKWLVASDMGSVRNIITQGLDMIKINKGKHLSLCLLWGPLAFWHPDVITVIYHMYIHISMCLYSIWCIDILALYIYNTCRCIYFTATHFRSRLPGNPRQGLTLSGPHPTRDWRVGSAWEAALRRTGPRCLTGGLLQSYMILEN